MNTAELIAAIPEIAGGNGYKMTLVLEELNKRLRMESAKSVGAAGIVKILDKVSQCAGNRSRPALMGAWIDSNGLQCVTDGFRAFWLKNKLPLVELNTSKVKPVELEKVRIREEMYLSAEYFPVKAAEFDLTALKAGIKLAKAEKKKAAVKVGDLFYNAEYFADMLAVFPDSTLYFPANRLYSPMTAVCEAGQALILPIRMMGEWADSWKIALEHPGNPAESAAA